MGFDVSQYQCGQFVPRAPIAIVQVSNGSLNKGPNPCFRQEAAWAGPEASDYIFMDAYPGGASAIEMKGPAAYCAAHNVGCRAFDYGAYWAMYWLGYARTQGLASRQWWLDVENTGSWAGTSVNQATISGARYLLRSQHVGVGIYSTRTQWRSIAGTMTFPGVDLWVPGAGNVSGRGYSATSLCQKWPSETFAGGHLEMVQWGYRGSFPGAYSGGSPFDLDYAC